MLDGVNALREARGATPMNLSSELTAAALFVFLTVQLVELFGLRGAAMAHAANYLIYWVLMATLIPRALKNSHTDA